MQCYSKLEHHSQQSKGYCSSAAQCQDTTPSLLGRSPTLMLAVSTARVRANRAPTTLTSKDQHPRLAPFILHPLFFCTCCTTYQLLRMLHTNLAGISRSLFFSGVGVGIPISHSEAIAVARRGHRSLSGWQTSWHSSRTVLIQLKLVCNGSSARVPRVSSPTEHFRQGESHSRGEWGTAACGKGEGSGVHC